jgi:hypothetical protein
VLIKVVYRSLDRSLQENLGYDIRQSSSSVAVVGRARRRRIRLHSHGGRMGVGMTAQAVVTTTHNGNGSTLREWHIAPDVWLLCQVEYVVHRSVVSNEANLVLPHGLHRICVSTSACH